MLLVSRSEYDSGGSNADWHSDPSFDRQYFQIVDDSETSYYWIWPVAASMALLRLT